MGVDSTLWKGRDLRYSGNGVYIFGALHMGSLVKHRKVACTLRPSSSQPSTVVNDEHRAFMGPDQLSELRNTTPT